jgi:hypothetical protein
MTLSSLGHFHRWLHGVIGIPDYLVSPMALIPNMAVTMTLWTEGAT